MIEDNRYYWSHLKTKTVTVRVAPKRQPKGIVFRVRNMIDLGVGRQTVMLEHVDFPRTFLSRKNTAAAAVPFRMGNFDFVYTSARKPKVGDVYSLLSTLYKEAQVEKIVADVLSPGDLLVFRQNENTMAIQLMETLRIVKENTYTKSTNQTCSIIS